MTTIQRTFLASILCAVGFTAGAEGIAFITDLKGDVAVDGNARPLLLSELAKGQRITVGKDSLAAVMYITSGMEYVLKDPGDYLVREVEISSASGMPPIARATEWRASSKVLAQAVQTSSASVRMRSIAAPKADKGPKLLYPTQGMVSTLRPAFRWRPAEARGDFSLLIAGQEKPVHQAKAVATGYRVPGRLKPDAEYAWTVTVAGEELGSGSFRTLPAETIALIEKRRPADKAEFSDRLLYALYLQEMGASQEAREWWERLSEERADLPELAALSR